jgi:hypothetical protein
MRKFLIVFAFVSSIALPSILFAQADSIPFKAGDTLTLLAKPWSVAVADFNGDSLPDFVTGSRDNFYFNYFKNNGNGQFADPVQTNIEVSEGGQINSIVASDLDGNGTIDLACAAYYSIFIVSNDGLANFQYERSIGVVNDNSNAAAYNIIAVDLNKDGKPDLVTSNFNKGNIAVHLNKGDLEFDTAVTYSSGSNTYTVCAGDFDGDGNIDLAATNISSASVSIFKGHGDGVFDTATNLSSATSPQYVTACDFDNDGDLDLAVSVISIPAIAIYINDGAGSLTLTHYVLTRNEPRTIYTADLNKDGYQDMAVACIAAGGPGLQIIKGNGDGSFGAASTYYSGSWTQSVAGADFDQDHDTDLVVVNYWYMGTGTITYYENLSGTTSVDDDHNGSQTVPATFSLGQNYPNPFNPGTTISFDLPRRSDVTVSIHNVLGQKVVTVWSGVKGAGTHSVYWNGKDEYDQDMSSGVYFYSLITDDYCETRKMILMK